MLEGKAAENTELRIFGLERRGMEFGDATNHLRV